MIAFAIVFFLLASLALATALYAMVNSEWAVGILTGAVCAMLIVLGVAAVNTEVPECNKVYEPGGSYVETCEYPTDV